MERLGWIAFEQRVGEYFSERLGCEFTEVAEQVGPDQNHKFDLVSRDGNVVIECKSYTWTSGGNFPQAKVSAANEAILFLSRIEADRKLLVMQDDMTSDGRSLVRTYVERYGGLMDDIEVWRYLARQENDDTVEQVREAGDIYRAKEVQPSHASNRSGKTEEQSFSGKYAPLYAELANADKDVVRFDFEELNSLLDERLPDSAYKYRVW